MTVATSPTFPLSYPVDAEHGGKRAVGCLAMFIAFVVILLSAITLIENGVFIGLIGGLIGAALVTTLVDRTLRNRWASGREVTIATETIQIVNKGHTEEQIDLQKEVSPLLYTFTVKRGGRVKKGWHVLALVLEQDETFLPIYTFCSPTEFEELPASKSFKLLEKKKGEDQLKLAGMQRRMLEAESYRSMNGAEMTFLQFQSFLETLETQFPKWMPKS